MNKKNLYGIVAILVVAATVLSACGPKATPTPAASTEVEVFSWWVGPGEADGLAAMVKVFNAQYPNIQFINAAVAGGAGTNAKAVLATRLAAGDESKNTLSWTGAGSFLRGVALSWTP